MSKQTARLAAYLQNNKLIVASVVTGIVAIGAIAGVLAWSNNSGSTEQPKETAQTEQKDTEQKPEEKKNEETAANTDNSGDTAVLGDSTSTESAPAPAPVVETAAVTPQPATSQPSTPSVPSDNTGNNGNEQPGQGGGNTGNNGGNQDPGTTPTDPGTTPTDPSTPADPAKFDKARVSLTFDDGWKSIHDNGLPLLQKYGLVSTQYINSEPTLKSDPASPVYDYWTGYMNFQDVKDFAAAGHEIAWHTNTHTYDLTAVDRATMDSELIPNNDFITMLMGVGVNLSDNFAAPFGTRNAETVAAAQAAGFNSYRTTDDGYNTKGATDPTNIKVKNICGIAGLNACLKADGTMPATTPEEVASWIAQAQADNAWLVIVFHEVTDTAEDPSYAVTPANLDAELALIKNSGIAVQTVDQALTELAPQL